jgi:hypothetical protein
MACRGSQTASIRFLGGIALAGGGVGRRYQDHVLQTLTTAQNRAHDAQRAAHAEQRSASGVSTIDRAVSDVNQAKRTVQAASSLFTLRTALDSAHRALDAARRAGRDSAARARVRDLEKQVEQLRRQASDKESEISSGDDKRVAAVLDTLGRQSLGVLVRRVPRPARGKTSDGSDQSAPTDDGQVQSLVDDVLNTRAVPRNDIELLLRQTRDNNDIPEETRRQLAEAWTKVEGVSSHAPGTAVYEVAGRQLGHANARGAGTLWLDTTRYHGRGAHGFAYEMIAASRFIDAPHPPGNGGDAVSIIAGRDQLIFGQKLPAGPNRKTVEADILIVRVGGHKTAIDVKDYARPFGNSRDLRAELEGVKHALRQGEVHEFHFAVSGRISDEAKKVIEAADAELRAELRQDPLADPTRNPTATISELQTIGLDPDKPMICWHEHLG